MLLQKPGEIVTREDIKRLLWPNNEFGDLDHAINVAIKKLRDGLNDDPENPQFIETMARRGYRFIAPVESRPDTALGASAIRSLAVLPFQNFASDSSQEYLADGMTEALITELAGIAALRVISRTSVMQYKGETKALPVIAHELDVDAVIEGSIQRHGDRVRVTVQLIEARNDRHLWAESYDGDFPDILILQKKIARALTDEIKVKLTAQERASRAPARSVNPEALEAYLKGRYHRNKLTDQGFEKAITCFERAIEKDPDYAPAYAGLADSYLSFANISLRRAAEVIPRARTLVVKALALDSLLAEAHVMAALIAWRHDRDWATAELEFQRAIALSPSYSAARQSYGWYLFALARHDESFAQLTRALKDDPLSVYISSNIGLALYCARRYDDAIEQLKEALEMDANFLPAHVFLGWTYEQKCMYGEAISEFERAIALEHMPKHLAALGHAYAISGKIVQAHGVLEELGKQSEQRYVSAYSVASIHAALGDIDQAFACLERSFEDRDGWMVYLKVDPLFDPLHSDARFSDLLCRMGVPS
jgi:TolB-like protein